MLLSTGNLHRYLCLFDWNNFINICLFQALSLLLNAQSFPFVIDLACLASRREYLKLEKWLTDKIREHGEPFINAVVKFLQVVPLSYCFTIRSIRLDESS